jgi:hypothetical protein
MSRSLSASRELGRAGRTLRGLGAGRRCAGQYCGPRSLRCCGCGRWPLDGGHPADQRPDLGIAQLLIAQPGLQEPVLAVADQGLVDRAAAPQVAGGEQLGRLPAANTLNSGWPCRSSRPGRITHRWPGLAPLGLLGWTAWIWWPAPTRHSRPPSARWGEHTTLQPDRLCWRRPDRQLPSCCRGRCRLLVPGSRPRPQPGRPARIGSPPPRAGHHAPQLPPPSRTAGMLPASRLRRPPRYGGRPTQDPPGPGSTATCTEIHLYWAQQDPLVAANG